ncbi:hypothetical protein DAPPUDRAFT_114386 [Daphnia pulex]|uniref:E3 ubiquitin-protein ligase n=1 Tax=Daphnia pulex TaxID=6669 RepID=E9HHZ4_DAPPU|nr:hypothetical protein DAPPUDRAFT_114386 [Daphnia pulex]|eukprot:EFX68655.1 hypothetical protein DAPPUDRAFT_114386 [Daphnia pulex]
MPPCLESWMIKIPLIRRCFTVRPDNPWDSEEIHSSRRCVRRFERRWKRTKLTIDKEIMLRGIQELHNMINKAKTTFLESQIQESSRKKVSLFRLIDSLLLPKPVLRLPAHSSLTELVERFGDFFVSKIVKIREDLDAAVGLWVPEVRVPVVAFVSFAPVSAHDVVSLIMNCPTKSSPLDPLPTFVLKESFATLSSAITEKRKWLSLNRLKLNEDKTDALLVSSKDAVRKKNISSMPLMVGDVPISPSPVVLNLAKDPSLEAINPIRILYGISHFWGTLYDVDYFQPILTNDGFIQKHFTNKVNEYLKLLSIFVSCGHFSTTFDRERALLRILAVFNPEFVGPRSAPITAQLHVKQKNVDREMIREDSKAILQKLTVKENAVLEIMFKGEYGFGSGPTREFFSLLSREIQRFDLFLWRGERVTFDVDGPLQTVDYVQSTTGIFPLPTTHRDQMNSTSGWSFYLVGKLLARCIMDSRQPGISFNTLFYCWMLDEVQWRQWTYKELEQIDVILSKSYGCLLDIVNENRRIEQDLM